MMTEKTQKAGAPTQRVESDTVSISVPGHLAEAVREFVRQFQDGNEDTRAQMLGMLTLPTTSEVVVTKRIDKSSPKL